jgi:polysaccharide biosynthesis protein PslH
VQFRVLQLCHVNIADPSSGSQLRNYYLACHLANVMEVTHLGFSDPGEMIPMSARQARIRTMLVPRERAYTVAKLVRGALGRTPAGLLNFQSAAMATALANELRAHYYDIVQIEGIEMSPHLPLIRSAKQRAKYVVLDWHNIESEVLARHSHHAATPLHRLYLGRATSQLKRIEDELLDSCDLHLATGERERQLLLSRRPAVNVVVVENGVDMRHFTQELQGPEDTNNWAARNRILFVGSMDYSANVDAVAYFVEQIWPRILRAFPPLVFTIVGRNPPEKVWAMASRPGIEVTGTVADVRPYYRKALAAVVPLRLGGGTRLKILEALAAGVPVLSTGLGAEGLRVHPETHFLLAERPADFHAQLRRLHEDFGLWRRLSDAGRKLVEATYDWNLIGKQLAEMYLNLLGGQRAADGQGGFSVREA